MTVQRKCPPGLSTALVIALVTLVTIAGCSSASSPSPESPDTQIPSDAFEATVAYVHDGDTLYLDTGTTELKVRLIGIDTPELASQQRPDAEDRFGRSLLYVYLDDGTVVNLAMIELGAAEAIKVGLNDRYWPELRDAEVEANAAGLGMWGSC